MHTEQKIWSNWSLRQQNYLNYPTSTEYFVITKICRSSCGGPLFVGTPVWPNLLNMPISASDRHSTRCGLLCPGVSRCQRMSFGRLLQELVHPMLWDCCPVSSVGVLWPNSWMDQDATWYRGRPQPR